MLIRPNDDYELCGTSAKLDKTKVYRAMIASNQPDFIAKKKIFVTADNADFLLEEGEYTIL